MGCGEIFLLQNMFLSYNLCLLFLLSRYNKTLLGDDMGRFPAPLLMNTVHFVMQAVLSKAITWYWSERFNTTSMSWKDYFVRGRIKFHYSFIIILLLTHLSHTYSIF